MENIKLGAFSISLVVKNLQESKAFYEKLGFSQTGGNPEQNWVILKNEHTIIGLFQGMFDKNILTFNPGWNQNAESIEEFDDVRTIEKHLLEKGITLNEKTKNEKGAAYITLTDPDGNSILIDQHRD